MAEPEQVTEAVPASALFAALAPVLVLLLLLWWLLRSRWARLQRLPRQPHLARGRAA